MTAFSPYHQSEIHSAKNVAVIGGGVIGSCIAQQLQNAGCKVTLIDAKGIAQGCSKGNAGHFATEQVFPLAELSLIPKLPKMLLDPLGPFRVKPTYLFKAMPWFLRFIANMTRHRFRKHTDALKQLNEKALDAFEDIFEQTNTQGLIVKQGSLLTFESTTIKKIESILQAYQRESIDVELLNREQTLQLEPNLSEKVTHSLWFKSVGHTLNPEFFVQSVVKKALAEGMAYIKDEVLKIIPKSERIELIFKSKSLRFDNVVVASGVWSKPLLRELGYKVPLEAERGYHLMLPQQTCLSRPVASYERKFIMTPMKEGLRLAGTVEFAGVNGAVNESRALVLKPHADALISKPLSNNNARTWMGSRPSLPDSLPVIGRSERFDNLYFAFGHQHLGLTQAGITAKLIKQLITNETPEIDLQPFAIERFN